MFLRNFLHSHIFPFFPPNIGMRNVPNILLPLLNFQTLEMFPVLPAFPVFVGKKIGIYGEKNVDR